MIVWFFSEKVPDVGATEASDGEDVDDEERTASPAVVAAAVAEAEAADEPAQFTPPKRRKLAARRRRHPAGDVGPALGPRRVLDAAESPAVVVVGLGGVRHRRGHHAGAGVASGNRPRRRRRHATQATRYGNLFTTWCLFNL